MLAWFNRVGCWFSALVADIAAHPFAQIGIIALCVIWLGIGYQVDVLTLALSILAITLTQMVLNTQKSRETEAHRRDMALHAKLDELVVAMKGARDELAGIEEREEEEIEAIRHHGAIEVTPIRGKAAAATK